MSHICNLLVQSATNFKQLALWDKKSSFGLSCCTKLLGSLSLLAGRFIYIFPKLKTKSASITCYSLTQGATAYQVAQKTAQISSRR